MPSVYPPGDFKELRKRQPQGECIAYYSKFLHPQLRSYVNQGTDDIQHGDMNDGGGVHSGQVFYYAK